MRHKQETSAVFPPALWCTRLIPNFGLAQAILQAYLTRYALPGAYITCAVEIY